MADDRHNPNNPKPTSFHAAASDTPGWMAMDAAVTQLNQGDLDTAIRWFATADGLGYPGAAEVRDAVKQLRDTLNDSAGEDTEDPHDPLAVLPRAERSMHAVARSLVNAARLTIKQIRSGSPFPRGTHNPNGPHPHTSPEEGPPR